MSKVAKKTASKTNLAFSGVARRRSAAVAPMRVKKGQVFLSYNAADKLVATQVAEKLAAAGYRITNGEDVVEPGENWLTAVGEALNRSDAVVFFLSRTALRSHSIPLELDFVLSKKRFKDRVIPILLDTEPGDVPWIVRHLPFVSMGKDSAGDAARVARAVVKELDQRV